MINPDDYEQVPGETPDQADELRRRLTEVAPEIFTDGQLDPERLQALLGEAPADTPERYGLNWPGKRAALALLQAP